MARALGGQAAGSSDVERFLVWATLLREFPGIGLDGVDRLPRRTVRRLQAYLDGLARAREKATNAKK